MRKYVRFGETEEIRYPKNEKVRIIVCIGLFAILFGLKMIPNEKVQNVLVKVREVSTSQVVPKEEDIGKLSYVSKLLPEAVQSVWQENTGKITLLSPFEDGVLLLDGKNGAVFEGAGDVLAGCDGKVQAVTRVAEGYTVIFDCGGGVAAAFTPLEGVKVAPSEIVEAGQSIGVAAGNGETRQIRVLVTRHGETVEAKEWLK